MKPTKAKLEYERVQRKKVAKVLAIGGAAAALLCGGLFYVEHKDDVIQVVDAVRMEMAKPKEEPKPASKPEPKPQPAPEKKPEPKPLEKKEPDKKPTKETPKPTEKSKPSAQPKPNASKENPEIAQVKAKFPELEKTPLSSILVAAEHYAVSKELLSFLKNNEPDAISQRWTSEMRLIPLRDVDDPARILFLYSENGTGQKHIFSVVNNKIEFSAAMPVSGNASKCVPYRGTHAVLDDRGRLIEECKIPENLFIEAEALSASMSRVDVNRINAERVRLSDDSVVHVYGTDAFRLVEFREPGTKYGFFILVRKRSKAGNHSAFVGFFEESKFVAE